MTERNKSEVNTLSEIPKLVQEYLKLDGYNTKGRYFRITIGHNSESKENAGISRSNSLTIEKLNRGLWIIVYSTGKIRYQDAFDKEKNNLDQKIKNPTILKEGPKHLIFGFLTEAGSVKIYRFQSGSSKIKLLTKFNINDID